MKTKMNYIPGTSFSVPFPMYARCILAMLLGYQLQWREHSTAVWENLESCAFDDLPDRYCYVPDENLAPVPQVQILNNIQITGASFPDGFMTYADLIIGVLTGQRLIDVQFGEFIPGRVIRFDRPSNYYSLSLPWRAEEEEPPVHSRMKPPPLLRAAADLFEQRNALYGNSFLGFGPMMMALFPNGFTAQSVEDWQRLGVLNMICSKVMRYAKNLPEGGHEDSARDMIVYSAMLQSLTVPEPKAKVL